MGQRGFGASRLAKVRDKAKKPAKPPIWDNPDLSRPEKVIAFLESLPITKGILVGTSMRLLPDQREFIQAVYGSDTVSIGVKSEPRGNGKTGLVSGLALCHLIGPEAELRGEVYSAASDRQQAAIIFAEMEAVIHAVPEFAWLVNVTRFTKRLEVLEGPGAGSTYEALPADARRGHGLAPSLWIYDELAQAKDSELLSSLRTGMGKRKRSLGLVISTQAPDDDHPLSRLIDAGLSGADPTILVHLTAAPMDADPFEPETIRAVNPALGIFLDEALILAEAEQARRTPLWEPKFRNLRLNQRVFADTDERLAQASVWRRGEGVVDLERLAGRTCYGGLDLSATQDLTAFVLVFPDDEPEPGYDVAAFFWTPEGELSKRATGEQEQMRAWIHAGHIQSIPGPIIRYAFVAEKIKALAERYDLQVIAYDPYQIQQLKMELDYDLPMEKFGQGHSQVMAPAIKFFDEVVKTGRLRHGGNPALTSSVLNAVVILDSSGNPKLDKSRGARGVKRIDGAVALVMALGMAQKHVSEHVEGGLVAV